MIFSISDLPITPENLREYERFLLEIHDEVPYGELCDCGDCLGVSPRLIAAADRIEELEKKQAALKDDNEALKKELGSSPTADALNKLWQDIILKRKPDYGDWEYPGQAYRHLLTEYEELKADPWQRITADPATLPPEDTALLISIDFKNGNGQITIDGYYHKGMWCVGKWNESPRTEHRPIITRYYAVEYAWQPWPAPAPYPDNEVSK
jgi:hypothetical protein